MAQDELQLSNSEVIRSIAEPPIVFAKEPDIEKIRDAAAEAAQLHIPIEDVFQTHIKPVTEAQRYLAIRNTAFITWLDRKQAEVDATIQSWRKKLDDAEEEYRRKETALFQLGQKERQSASAVAGMKRIIQARLPEFLVKYQAILDDSRRSREKQELEHRQSIAQVQADLAAAALDKNQAYLDDLRAEATHDRERLSKPLQEAAAANHRLQEQGLTPFVANFLMWASAVSLGGIAPLLATLIASRQSKTEAPSERMVGFMHWLGLGGSGQNILAAMGRYFGIVILALLGITAVCLAFFFLLPKLESKAELKQEAAKADKDWLGDVLSFFHFNSPELSKGLSAITRRSITHILTLLPVIFCLAVGFFGWIVLAAPITVSTSHDSTPQQVYLGVIFLLLFLSSATLFWIFVGRPSNHGEAIRRGTRIGYALLCALPLLTLIAYASLPRSMDNLAIALMAVSAMVALYGGAQGFFVLGKLLREADLQSQDDRLGAALLQLRRVPTANDYLEARSVQEALHEARVRAREEELIRVQSEERERAEKEQANRQRKAPPGDQPEPSLWQRIMFILMPPASPPEPLKVQENQFRQILDQHYVPLEVVEETNEKIRLHEFATAELTACENECKLLEKRIAEYSGRLKGDQEVRDRIDAARLLVLDKQVPPAIQLEVVLGLVREAIRLGHGVGAATSNYKPASISGLSDRSEKENA